MLSLRRNAGQNDEGTARFLYAILRQLECRSVDWDKVAEDVEATNGHAARMRWTRFKTHMEGGITNNPPPTKHRASKKRKAAAVKMLKKSAARSAPSSAITISKAGIGIKETATKVEEQETDEEDEEEEKEEEEEEGAQQFSTPSSVKVEDDGEGQDEDEDEDADGKLESVIKEEPISDVVPDSMSWELMENANSTEFVIGEEFDELMDDPFFLSDEFCERR